MEEKNVQKLTLGGLEKYEIKVPGYLDQSWSDWIENLMIVNETVPEGRAVSTLTGKFDQAALIGLLRRLYSLGLPLISVNWLERGKDKS